MQEQFSSYYYTYLGSPKTTIMSKVMKTRNYSIVLALFIFGTSFYILSQTSSTSTLARTHTNSIFVSIRNYSSRLLANGKLPQLIDDYGKIKKIQQSNNKRIIFKFWISLLLFITRYCIFNWAFN